jgi:O-antigen ligase
LGRACGLRAVSNGFVSGNPISSFNSIRSIERGKHLFRKYAVILKSDSFSRWVNITGIAGLYMFAFGLLFKKGLAIIGLAMMTLSFSFTLKDCWREAVRDRLLVVSAAFFLFLVVRTFFAAMEFPSHVPQLIEGASKLFGSGFFLVYLVAFWLHKTRDQWDLVLIVLMAGFLVQILRNIEWGNLSSMIDALQSQRGTFGFASNRLGFFSSILLTACLLLFRHIWGSGKARPMWRSTRIFFWLLMFSLSSYCLAISQSRTSLIASLCVIPFAIGFKALRQHMGFRRLMPALLILGIVGIVLYASGATKNLEQRLGPGNYESGFHSRLSLYKIAYDNLKMQPFLGRGPGTSELLIQQSGPEYDTVKTFDHLHNLILDIAAQIGIIGIGFIGISFLLTICQPFRLQRVSTNQKDYILFALSGISMMLISGMTNQPLHSPHGVFLGGYLGGICYSFKFLRSA